MYNSQGDALHIRHPETAYSSEDFPDYGGLSRDQLPNYSGFKMLLKDSWRVVIADMVTVKKYALIQ